MLLPNWNLTNILAGVGCGLASLWMVKTYLQYRRLMLRMGGAPGPKTFFSPATPLTLLLPNIPGINRRNNWSWKLKYQAFQQYGQDIVAAITFYPAPRATLHLGDPKTIREVTSHRSSFPKPVQAYKLFEYFGANTVTTEGDKWKIHHKVVAKSFNEQNNKLVWRETVHAVLELFSLWELEDRGDEASVTDISELTRDLTLMVISAAGELANDWEGKSDRYVLAFGMKTPWKDEADPPPGHTMTFKKSLRLVRFGLVHRLVLPDWVLKLYPFGREVRIAYMELSSYMGEMVENRMTSPDKHDDLFSNLLKAREDNSDGDSTFSDSDLTGNIFAILFAGHETSANTLAFALAFIALYPEVQERFLAQIRQCVPPGQLPTYADMSKLSYGTAIMQETLRLIPVVPVIPKTSAYDTQFATRHEDGEMRHVPVKAETTLVINFIGLHYNPKYWQDPYEFRPERFLQEYEKFAWLPFSAGPRACIGRRFAEIEILAILTLFVMKYEITVTDEPKFASETLEQRRARLLDAERTMVTMRARRIPLTFKRR